MAPVTALFGAVPTIGPFGAALPAVTLPVPAAIRAAVIAATLFARAIIALTVFTLPIITGPVFAGTVAGPVIALAVVGTVVPLPVIALAAFRAAIIAAIMRALVTAIAGIALVAIVFIGGVAAVAIGLQRVIVIAVAAAPAFGLAVTIIAQDPIIMLGILQIIFCGHPITGLLGIAGQGTIFFQQLGGIAALPVVQPRAIIVATSHLLRARPVVAATPPPPLVVPDQDRRPRCSPDAGRWLARVGEIWPVSPRPAAAHRRRRRARDNPQSQTDVRSLALFPICRPSMREGWPAAILARAIQSRPSGKAGRRQGKNDAPRARRGQRATLGAMLAISWKQASGS